jgi:hypothetical protein
MPAVKRNKSIKDMTEIESLRAENVTLRALLDYTAMMTDVELPEEESEVTIDE